MPPEAGILVVDDEVEIRRFLRISLAAHGYDVMEAARGETALAAAASGHPDLVILDLGLPDMDGVDVIRRLRAWSEIPILVLSVRAEEEHKVAALRPEPTTTSPSRSGSPNCSRACACCCAAAAPMERARKESVYTDRGLTVNFASRQVFVDGREVHLTRKEFDLLRLLARQAGNMLTHEMLLREAWGPAHTTETHYLRIHIGHLRQKLGDDPSAPRFIWTEPGVGYRLITEG